MELTFLSGIATSGEMSIGGACSVGGVLEPNSLNDHALGDVAHAWSDLFLGDGSVINFYNGDVTLTHSADMLTLAGGGLTLGSTLHVDGVATLDGGCAINTTSGNALLLHNTDLSNTVPILNIHSARESSNLFEFIDCFAGEGGSSVEKAYIRGNGDTYFAGELMVGTGFGCNGAAPQTGYANAPWDEPGAGAYGVDSAAHMAALVELVQDMQAALVANGILATPA
jgi:hypothetical protein